MSKYMLAGKAREHMVAAESEWLMGLGRHPRIESCIVHFAAVPPPSDDIDLVIELGLRDGAFPPEATAPFEQADVYGVREVVEKGAARLEPGWLPGITYLSRNPAQPGLSAAEVDARYARHGPLAVRVHIGMDRYVRNSVTEASPGALPLASLSVLHFPTKTDLADRLYVDDAGRDAILADVQAFLDVDDIRTMTANTWVVR